MTSSHKLYVLAGAAGVRRKRENRLAVGRALLQPDALADHGLEDLVAEDLADLGADVSSEGGPAVVHGDDDAQDPELGIGSEAYFLDRFEQVVGALEREVRRLNRNEQVRGGHQGVDGQEAEGGRTIDHDRLVLVEDLMQLVFEAERRIELPRHPRLEFGERNARRRDRQILVRRRQDDVTQRDGRFDEHVVHAASHGLQIHERHAAIGLGIEIDQQRSALSHGQRSGQIDGGGRLADAPFLIGNRENHSGRANRSDCRGCGGEGQEKVCRRWQSYARRHALTV